MAAIKKKWTGSVLAAFLAFFLILAFVPFQKNYVFVRNDTDTITAYLPLKEASFQIKYTHTIHRSDVLEIYKVLKDNSLVATGLVYEDFSIGMPSDAAEGETFSERNGKYHITNMARKMADFRLFIGDVDADLFFLTASDEIDLKKTLERGQSYTVRVQRLSFIQQLKGVNLNEQEIAS
ncbi:DUF1850 domain-containing protein [Planococcus sp. N028]|uniref:DUF1850 domain-containing protein n=2 Tax=Planococcus shixiaomingii TaxID=3058393 RepID=A0ABT8N0N1_9BACL|nr:DUF1850 domain-containing protein [Planococcus sp. N028]